MNDFDDFPSVGVRHLSIEKAIKAYDELFKIKSRLNNKVGDEDCLKVFKSLYEDNSGSTLYRASIEAKNDLISIWMARVFDKADFIKDLGVIKEFNGVDESWIRGLVSSSVDRNVYGTLQKKFAEKGILLIYVEAVVGAKVDGAIYFSNKRIPVIALSLRYHRVDYFWFTLLHELAHLLLHSELLDKPIVDDFECQETNLVDIEVWANKAAVDYLIPRNKWRSSPLHFRPDMESLFAFSRALGIDPAIVAGRYRNEKKRYDIFSNIVNDFDVREVVKNVWL